MVYRSFETRWKWKVKTGESRRTRKWTTRRKWTVLILKWWVFWWRGFWIVHFQWPLTLKRFESQIFESPKFHPRPFTFQWNKILGGINMYGPWRKICNNNWKCIYWIYIDIMRWKVQLVTRFSDIQCRKKLRYVSYVIVLLTHGLISPDLLMLAEFSQGVSFETFLFWDSLFWVNVWNSRHRRGVI